MIDLVLIKSGDFIKFKSERLPYRVMAVKNPFAICVRKLHIREDSELLHNRVEMNAYTSFTEAYKANKENPVYTIIDIRKKIRGPHNLVFGVFNYFDEKECQEAITWLHDGRMKISHRNTHSLDLEAVGTK